MFQRKVRASFRRITENGMVNFQTVVSRKSACEKLSLKTSPSGILGLFSFFKKARTVSIASFVFSNAEFIGCIEFFESFFFKIFCITLFNGGKNENRSFFVFPRFTRLIPLGTEEGAISAASSKGRARISWSRKRGKFRASFEEDLETKSVKADFTSSLSDSGEEIFCVLPVGNGKLFSLSRFVPLISRGEISPLSDEEGGGKALEALSLFSVSRFFAKSFFETLEITAFCEVEGKALIFHFETGSYDADDADEYNKNFLSLGGIISTLPGVCITHPFGEEGKWVVQDTENMVDLVFTVQKIGEKSIDVIMIKKKSVNFFGTVEGILVTKDGRRVKLSGARAMALKRTLRV